MKRALTFLTIVITAVFFVAGFASYAAAQGAGLSGKVIETMDSGGYTYVHLESNGKKVWVAIPQTKVVKGQNMSFIPGAEMENFESKTLNRKFDKIVFSAGPLTSDSSKDGAKSSGSKANVVVTGEKIKVQKASGADAYTVAEIYKNKEKLDKKEVAVRGKVVKVSAGIMGKNWIHLQDGTGDPAKSTHDLVATSKDLPSVGDVVTAKGTLYKDKDFGSNYKYAVIIEGATIKK